MSSQMMEAVRTSESSVYNHLHGSTSQKTILNIILAAVRTWNLTYASLFERTETGYQDTSSPVKQMAGKNVPELRSRLRPTMNTPA
jgi:hypothetical protein